MPVSLVDVLPTCLHAAGIKVTGDRVGLDLAQAARGEADREGVSIQFNQEGSGLYGYVTHEYKYAYSAPDNREWLLRRAPGQPEQRSLAGNAAYDGTLRQMRETLIRHFRADGYEAPLQGDGWKAFPRQAVPSDPDAWQLFQEGGPVDDLFPEGYESRCRPQGGPPVRGI